MLGRNHRRLCCRLLLLAVIIFCIPLQGTAAPCAPLESHDIVARVVRHELDAAPTQGRWMYTATYTKDSVVNVARRIETDDGVLTWVISHNGVPLSDSEKASQRAALNNLISSPDLLDRNRKATQADALRINTLLQDLPDSVQFDCIERSGDTASVHFSPRAGYAPWNIEQRVIAGMSGTLKLNLNETRLITADGTMQDDLSLLFGLGRIYKGSSVSLKRATTVTGAWETTSVSTHINGQIFFLKTIAQNRDETRSDYCPVKRPLSAQNALPYLEDPQCPPIR